MEYTIGQSVLILSQNKFGKVKEIHEKTIILRIKNELREVMKTDICPCMY
jgi:hypothetical protein